MGNNGLFHSPYFSLGVGLACVVEPAVTNLARNRLLFSNLKTSGSAEGAVVKLNEMGEVVAIAASIPNGQGHETVAAEVVANTLGVSPEKVRVLHGDTDIVHPSPYGGTWGSRFSVMTAAAVKKACERLREKIIKISSALLEAAPEDLEIVDGSVHVRGSKSIPRHDSPKEFGHKPVCGILLRFPKLRNRRAWGV
jgi:2-furoyl-CoA dehydrogenase large subunit